MPGMAVTVRFAKAGYRTAHNSAASPRAFVFISVLKMKGMRKRKMIRGDYQSLRWGTPSKNPPGSPNSWAEL
jgi:hypothetical protein